MRAIFLCLLGTVCFAATPDHSKSEDLSRQEVNVVRLINTAAVTFELQNHRPATWEELVASMPKMISRSKMFKNLGSVLNFKDPANFYPGHTIRWTAPASGKGWDVAMTRDNSADAMCTAPTWFSNDRGVIFQAYAIDCKVSATKADD